MAEVVNLRRARKAKGRAAAEQQAAENRAVYGEPRLAKQMRRLLDRQADEKLDGHLRSVERDEG